jgi:tetratricopeptide (TPR) repeat protein
MDWRRPARALALATVAGLLFQLTPAASAAQAADPGSLRRQAIELAYSHRHDEAIAILRKATSIAPDDSATHRALASVLWLTMLFRRGAVTVDHYLGSFSKSKVNLPPPPPELADEFRVSIGRAITLAEGRIAAAPNDPQGHFDLGAAVGLQASFTATIEGSLIGGFRAARRAFDAHERVLELDPSRREAGLIVGTYRYIISTLSLPMRMMAYVAGFGGGRERGIQMIEEAARAGEVNREDAMFALVLVYNREKRYDDALRVLEELRRLYPRNRLILLEAGSTALRAERPDDADRLLTRGLEMFSSESGPRIPGEEALWRYKRGAARVAAGRTDAALADLQVAATPDAQAWVHGRARVELGRVALGRGDRSAARGQATQARSLCEQGNDPVCVADARRLLRSSDGG